MVVSVVQLDVRPFAGQRWERLPTKTYKTYNVIERNYAVSGRFHRKNCNSVKISVLSSFSEGQAGCQFYKRAFAARCLTIKSQVKSTSLS